MTIRNSSSVWLWGSSVLSFGSAHWKFDVEDLFVDISSAISVNSSLAKLSFSVLVSVISLGASMLIEATSSIIGLSVFFDISLVMRWFMTGSFWVSGSDFSSLISLIFMSSVTSTDIIEKSLFNVFAEIDGGLILSNGGLLICSVFRSFTIFLFLFEIFETFISGEDFIVSFLILLSSNTFCLLFGVFWISLFLVFGRTVISDCLVSGFFLSSLDKMFWSVLFLFSDSSPKFSNTFSLSPTVKDLLSDFPTFVTVSLKFVFRMISSVAAPWEDSVSTISLLSPS